jgi:large subunit ribosomal protein L24
VLTKKDRVVLEFSNLSPQKRELIGKKTVKKNRRSPQQGNGMVERSVSVHVSNVTPVQAAESK